MNYKRTLNFLVMLCSAVLLSTGVSQAAVVLEVQTDMYVLVEPPTLEGENLSGISGNEQSIEVVFTTLGSPLLGVSIDLFNIFNFGDIVTANLLVSGGALSAQGTANLAAGDNFTVTPAWNGPIDFDADTTYSLLVSVATGGNAVWSTNWTNIAESQATLDAVRTLSGTPLNNPVGFAINAQTVVPEPGTLALLGAGFVGLALLRFRRR